MAIGLLAAGALALLLIPRNSAAGSPVKPSLAGTVLLKKPLAPEFRLHDQFGRTVTLSQFRGRPVLVTFMESHCAQLCPRVADKIRQAVDETGVSSKRLGVLAVSTDPEGDTPAASQAFSRQHGLLHRWRYLSGPRNVLTRIWHEYYVYAAPKGASSSLDAAHTSATYLVDATGRERALMGGDLSVNDLELDIRLLAGLPVGRPIHLDAAPQVGHPAPDFVLPGAAGKPVRLSDLRGKVVLLNFWATSCPPCRSEMPRLSQWYTSLRRSNFTVIGVDSLDDTSAALGYTKGLHVSYPIAVDTDGNVSVKYDVVALPSSFLIDRNGIVRATRLGVVGSSYLTHQIRPLMESRSGA
jgi:protein SCO1/2